MGFYTLGGFNVDMDGQQTEEEEHSAGRQAGREGGSRAKCLLRERERMPERGVSDPCVCEFCGDDGRSSCSRRRRRLSSSPLTRMVVGYNRPKRILDGTRGWLASLFPQSRCGVWREEEVGNNGCGDDSDDTVPTGRESYLGLGIYQSRVVS